MMTMYFYLRLGKGDKFGQRDIYSKAWEPKFGYSTPMQNPGMMAHIWNPALKRGKGSWQRQADPEDLLA